MSELAGAANTAEAGDLLGLAWGAAMAAIAASAGWRLETAVETGPRYLACLRRSDRSP